AMPIEAAEMALLRVVHASQLPDPGELARKLASGEFNTGAPSSAPAPAASAPAPMLALPADGQAIHDLLMTRHPLLSQQFHDYASIIRLSGTDLAMAPHTRLPASFVGELATALRSLTGQIWTVSLTDGAAEPTLLAREQAAEHDAREAILAMPIIRAALQAFPEAELIEYSVAEPRSLAS
ncbi:MAG: polymerase subunit gamma/tau, partial [Rhizorhabdus sp.]|nr:polymerase subunit gamma/tau [Rhizorhabdus sp.]